MTGYIETVIFHAQPRPLTIIFSQYFELCVDLFPRSALSRLHNCLFQIGPSHGPTWSGFAKLSLDYGLVSFVDLTLILGWVVVWNQYWVQCWNPIFSKNKISIIHRQNELKKKVQMLRLPRHPSQICHCSVQSDIQYILNQLSPVPVRLKRKFNR